MKKYISPFLVIIFGVGFFIYSNSLIIKGSMNGLLLIFPQYWGIILGPLLALSGIISFWKVHNNIDYTPTKKKQYNKTLGLFLAAMFILIPLMRLFKGMELGILSYILIISGIGIIIATYMKQ